LTDPADSIWDELIDCAEATAKPSERAEALRVAAIWEELRATTFEKMYLEEKALRESVIAAAAAAAGRESRPSQTLADAQAAGAVRAAQAQAAVAARDAEAQRRNEQGKKALQAALADPSTLVMIQADTPITDENLAKAVEHNRALCDQTITVAGLTPNGLALYVPPVGQKFMAKNSKNYPHMCLVEDANHFAPGVRTYLLVYAYSEGAFAGFQPITQARTTPVSGSGTMTNTYGNQWNFTYT
jgi:hypothetical protein